VAYSVERRNRYRRPTFSRAVSSAHRISLNPGSFADDGRGLHQLYRASHKYSMKHIEALRIHYFELDFFDVQGPKAIYSAIYAIHHPLKKKAQLPPSTSLQNFNSRESCPNLNMNAIDTCEPFQTTHLFPYSCNQLSSTKYCKIKGDVCLFVSD
jgi:hypothetical protein